METQVFLTAFANKMTYQVINYAMECTDWPIPDKEELGVVFEETQNDLETRLFQV